GYDDGAAGRHLAVGELELVAAGCASQCDGCRRHGQARSELERLDPGSLGELAAGDPGREAEVIFDPGRGARLATGGNRLDTLDVEPFRCGIEGGGESGR